MPDDMLVVHSFDDQYFSRWIHRAVRLTHLDALFGGGFELLLLVHDGASALVRFFQTHKDTLAFRGRRRGAREPLHAIETVRGGETCVLFSSAVRRIIRQKASWTE